MRVRLTAAGIALGLVVAIPATAYAAQVDFEPANVTETNSLSDAFDDDVDTTGNRRGDPKHADNGDTIRWDYLYKRGGPGYVVMNSDPADIELLRLYGKAGGETEVTVTLQFLDGAGNPIGAAYAFPKKGWGANLVTISKEDDKLGDLSGLECIGGFRVDAAFTGGAADIEQITFDWETDDIEKKDCTPQGAGRFFNERRTMVFNGPGNSNGLRVKENLDLACETSGFHDLSLLWGGLTNPQAHRFDLDSIGDVNCGDSPAILSPGDPFATFDVHSGEGTGRLDGVAGATIEWSFSDAGEPGRRTDRSWIKVTTPGGTAGDALSVSRFVGQGNHQAVGDIGGGST